MKRKITQVSQPNVINWRRNSIFGSQLTMNESVYEESQKKCEEDSNHQSTESNSSQNSFINNNNERDAFNIVITNVTSLAAEAFIEDDEEQAPMVLDDAVEQYYAPPLVPAPPLTNVSKTMKRNYPEEDIDCQILSEGPKRARLDDGLSQRIIYSQPSVVNAESNFYEEIVVEGDEQTPLISNAVNRSCRASSIRAHRRASSTSLDNVSTIFYYLFDDSIIKVTC